MSEFVMRTHAVETLFCLFWLLKTLITISSQIDDMEDPEEELRQFKQYLIGKGKKYEDLNEDQLLRWSETFDKYKALQSQTLASQAQAGKDWFSMMYDDY